MCGIAGQYLLNHTVAYADATKRMIQAMKHRGPDGEGYYSSGNISLGHCRLAIIDLSKEGNQPLFNEDETLVLICNGEIYNYIELRDILEMKGHKFRTQTDSEVILHAYEEWSVKCLSQFSGMFAFALWDSKNNYLFLARDPFGIKPLYYVLTTSMFLFASEIKGILASQEWAPVPDDRVLETFISTGLADFSEGTMFRGILQVRPGEYMLFVGTPHPIITSYFAFHVSPSPHDFNISDKEAENGLSGRFTRSIQLHLRSDVPIGSCLSGGLDSSFLVSSLRNALSPSTKIQNTFSILFPGHDEIDESKQITTFLCEQSGIDGHYYTPDSQQLWRDLPNLIYTQDEPFLSASVYAQYSIMKYASSNVKVMMDGQGADELFAGYPEYYLPLMKDLAVRGHLFSLSRDSIGFAGGHIPFITSTLNKLLRRFIMKDVYYTVPLTDYVRFKGRFSTVLENEVTHTNLPALLHWEDRNSMAHSIEARVPYLDLGVARYAAELPYDQKIRGCITKVVLRNAAKGIVPEVIRTNRRKIGFAVPEEQWMHELSDNILLTFAEKQFRERPYWNAEKVLRRFTKFSTGNIPYCSDFWRILCTELWLRQWFGEGI